MNKMRYDIILKYLEGDLSEEEGAAFEKQLAQSEELRKEVSQVHTVQKGLKEATNEMLEGAVRPFLADRVVRALDRENQHVESISEDFFNQLVLVFRPIAIASVLLVLTLAFYNYQLSSEYETELSAGEALLALPPVSSASVYALDYFDSPNDEVQ